MPPPSTADNISPQLIEDVCTRLASGLGVRRELPGGGLLSCDQLRPFLCVYRRRAAREDSGTSTFVKGEAAFLTLPGTARVRKGLKRLVIRLAETAAARFGAFFIIEVWSSVDPHAPPASDAASGELVTPSARFWIHERPTHQPTSSVDQLAFALRLIQVDRQPAEVEVVTHGRAAPPGSKELISVAEGLEINCFKVGLEIEPIYRDGVTGELFPKLLRQLHGGVSRALQKAFFAFSLAHTNVRPEHYFALGRGTLPAKVWRLDHDLAELGSRLDFLLQVTPINSESARREFEAGGHRDAPSFVYRPLRLDPLLLKRKVNQLPTERIADPTMAHLLRQTQDELDRMITMLGDLATSRFLPGSLQVFGAVAPPLLELAEQMLAMPRTAPAQTTPEPAVGCEVLLRRARRKMLAYRRQHPDFAGTAMVRDDIFSGLMVSAGHLLIGRETAVPESRVEALLAHEVDTHMVTFYNGRAQPLQLLASGLAGYDALQEGLAVLAEYLVGGLSRGRLRMLAARVIAAHMMIGGAPFSDVWRRLVDEYKFKSDAAWTIAMRVYRGGGLTKDVAYLVGLVEILDYLGKGGELEPLYLGKLAVEHVPILRELRFREVLRAPPLTPHFMSDPKTTQRLARIRRGITVLDLFQD